MEKFEDIKNSVVFFVANPLYNLCSLNIFWSVSELDKNKIKEIETTNLIAKQVLKRIGNLVVGYCVAVARKESHSRCKSGCFMSNVLTC